MQKNVIEMMENIVDKSDDSFLTIISEIVLENLDQIETLQIKDISDKSHYSISSITKFCQKLGCSGWKEFKTSLLMYHNYTDKNKKVDNIIFDSSEKQIIENIKEHSIMCINKTWEQNEKQIIKLKRYIEYYDKVIIYGVGFNQVIIKHFLKNLILLKKNCIFNEDIDIQKKLSKLESKNTLHIIFSFSGVTPSLKKIINNIIKKRTDKSRIVAFTGNINSHIAENSDLVLLLPENETPLRQVSYQGMLFLVNVLISLLLKDDGQYKN